MPDLVNTTIVINGSGGRTYASYTTSVINNEQFLFNVSSQEVSFGLPQFRLDALIKSAVKGTKERADSARARELNNLKEGKLKIKCPNGHVFTSKFFANMPNLEAVEFVGNREQCPRCGAMASAPDVAGGAISYPRGTDAGRSKFPIHLVNLVDASAVKARKASTAYDRLKALWDRSKG